jgi:hypothetical protein
MILTTVKEAEEASKKHSCQNTEIKRADDPRTMMFGWFCAGCDANWRAPLYNRDGKLSFTDIWERSCQFSHSCTDNGVNFSVRGIVLDKVLNNISNRRKFNSLTVSVCRAPKLRGDSLTYAEKRGFKPNHLLQINFDFGFQWTADPDTLENQAKVFADGMRLLRHLEKHPKSIVRLDVSNSVD